MKRAVVFPTILTVIAIALFVISLLILSHLFFKKELSGYDLAAGFTSLGLAIAGGMSLIAAAIATLSPRVD